MPPDIRSIRISWPVHKRFTCSPRVVRSRYFYCRKSTRDAKLPENCHALRSRQNRPLDGPAERGRRSHHEHRRAQRLFFRWVRSLRHRARRRPVPTNHVDLPLYYPAASLRGSPIAADHLPDLREDHHALASSGDPAVARYALVNIANDRIANSPNTLAMEVLAWEPSS